MIQVDKIKVYENDSIRKAVQVMDSGGIGFIYVVNDRDKIAGIVSDGDFRRAILKGVSLDDGIQMIMNRYFLSLNEDYKDEDARKIFKETVVRHIPVLSDRVVLAVITEDDLQEVSKTKKRTKMDLPVVIMAGGRGARLDPFTRILPKPLIPIGDKTIIEIIIDKFRHYGIDLFYLSVHHKASIIKSYFEELSPDYQIVYLHENKPLGTAGGIRQLYGRIEGPFILTNCDIIIEADYGDLLKYHVEAGNDITLVASVKHYSIPYGVCKIENGGSLIAIEEKPSYDFLVNTGMYIVNAEVLKYISENQMFHMTHLIEKVKENNGKVGIYPVSDSSWIDIGEWVEYKKTVERFNMRDAFQGEHSVDAEGSFKTQEESLLFSKLTI